MTKFDIHISDVLAFKACRRKWDYSSLLRRNLTPLGVYAPFFTGRVIHGGVDSKYRYGLHPVEMVDEFVHIETEQLRVEYPTLYQAELPIIEKETALCKGILNHYQQWSTAYNGTFNDRSLDFLNIEQSFRVPLRTPRNFIARRFQLAGRFDGVARHKADDKLYLWEVKTTTRMQQRISMLDLEEQPDAYAIAAQELLGEPIAGIIYTLIRKALPATPEVLKNGNLSQNKAIDTTFEHYLAAIRNHHQHNATREFISATYGDFLQHLLDNGKPFFERVMIRRSPAQLKTARNELYAVATEMTNPSVPIYHHGQYGCNWCIFKEPCLAMQQGNTAFAEQLIDRNYVQNTYHQQRSDDE